MILAALAVVAVVDWWAVWTRRRAVEVVAKPATAALLVALAATAGDVDGAVRAALVVAAVCGLAGDVALLGRGETAFMAGLGAFAVGHLAYAVAAVAGDVSWAAGAARRAVPRRAARLALRRRDGARRQARRRAGARRGRRVLRRGDLGDGADGDRLGSWWAALGAALFAASDWVLGHDRFVRPWRYARIVVMVTYHVGQALLILGLSGAI